jgi:hypothetical protein
LHERIADRYSGADAVASERGGIVSEPHIQKELRSEKTYGIGDSRQ